MRKTIRRIVCMTAALLVLFSLAPAPARAVDPVSAATMANALAQAITAYGASNGVSMMYDVTDTNGIGEGVHDLWDQFKADINDNDVPMYDSLAVTTWSTIYKKIGNSVAINLSDTTVSYLDRFWNWLLSGPAEMQKVDNQYFQWQVNSNNTVTPISVHASDFYLINGHSVPLLSKMQWVDGNVSFVCTFSSPVACYISASSSSSYATYFFMGLAQSQVPYSLTVYNNASVVSSSNSSINDSSYNGFSYKQLGSRASYELSSFSDVPIIVSSSNDPESCFGAFTASDVNTINNTISVSPYIGDTVPKDVYIPDNDDVNYQPLPYVGPLNIPWQTAWGDGETIDDAGAKDIADALDQQIVDDGTLQLEGDNTVNPPIDDVIGGPNDYQVPGLADVFPFCIPFDIYNFLSALAADPVAPHFTAQLDFPEAIGGTQTIDLDFDLPTWNQLAQLLRLLELLAFIVGLALLTRSMFIRG